jgi:hypothetical protein
VALPLPLQVVPENTINDMRGPIARDIIGWNDLVLAPIASGGIALTAQTFLDTPFTIQCFRNDFDTGSLAFSFQMSHAWQPGTLVRPHLHLIPLADPAVPEVAFFVGQYAWMSTSLALAANAAWTPITGALTVNPGDVNKMAVLDLTSGNGIQPPDGIAESDLLLVYVFRDANNVLDTYSTNKVGGTPQCNLGILSSDCHFQTQKAGGSQEEIPG